DPAARLPRGAAERHRRRPAAQPRQVGDGGVAASRLAEPLPSISKQGVIPEARASELSGIYFQQQVQVDPGQALRAFRDDNRGVAGETASKLKLSPPCSTPCWWLSCWSWW